MKRLLLLAAFLLLGASCNAQTSTTTPNGSTLDLPKNVPPVTFSSGEVKLSTKTDTYTLKAEFADTEAERERGLMYRHSMPETSGMLFIFDADQTGGFWMYNTFIPLSLAYIDSQGRIINILKMKACGGHSQSECSREAAGYLSSAPYRYALEVNKGYFAAHHIAAGDSVSYSIGGK